MDSSTRPTSPLTTLTATPPLPSTPDGIRGQKYPPKQTYKSSSLKPTSPLTSPTATPPPPSTPDRVGSLQRQPKRTRRSSSEICDSDPTTSSSSSSLNRSIKRRRRFTQEERLSEVLEKLRKLWWSVQGFLAALCKNRARHRVPVAQKQFLDFAYNRLPKDKQFSKLVGQERKSTVLSEWGWVWVVDTLRVEINALATHPAFGLFKPPSDGAEVGSLEFIKQAASAIE